MIVELGERLYFAAGSDKNIKLTTKDDLEMFKACLLYTYYESGERQRMEMYYVEHCSLWLDVKILFRTVFSVTRAAGAQ